MSEEADPTTAGIEAAIRDYVEGWYEGDPVRMARALHDDLAKRTPSNGDDGVGLPAVSKERMVALTSDGGGGTPGSTYEISIHDVSGGMASAQVRSLEYLDYMHLVATEAGWKIANILFRTHT